MTRRVPISRPAGRDRLLRTANLKRTAAPGIKPCGSAGGKGRVAVTVQVTELLPWGDGDRRPSRRRLYRDRPVTVTVRVRPGPRANLPVKRLGIHSFTEPGASRPLSRSCQLGEPERRPVSLQVCCWFFTKSLPNKKELEVDHNPVPRPDLIRVIRQYIRGVEKVQVCASQTLPRDDFEGLARSLLCDQDPDRRDMKQLLADAA